MLIEDMLADLDRYAIAEIDVAIRTYRLNPQNRFFPRSADLIGIISAERRHRMDVDTKKKVVPEFGDSRPLMWEYQRKRFWMAHWKAADLDRARDPERRERYEKWRKAVKAGKVSGLNPNEY